MSDEGFYTKWRGGNGTVGRHIVSKKVNKAISEKKGDYRTDTRAGTERANAVKTRQAKARIIKSLELDHKLNTKPQRESR